MTFDQDEYHDQHFERLHLPSEEIVGKVFYDCTFDTCNFAESQILDCRFFDCVFENCDMSLIKVGGTTFVSTRFQGSKVIGVNWIDANWRSIAPHKIDFFKSDVSYSLFGQLKLQGIHFEGCKAHDADFTETDLTEAHCRDTDFAQTNFHQTNLTNADFVGATNYNISLINNTVKGAKFSLPEALKLLTHFEIEIVDE